MCLFSKVRPPPQSSSQVGNVNRDDRTRLRLAQLPPHTHTPFRMAAISQLQRSLSPSGMWDTRQAGRARRPEQHVARALPAFPLGPRAAASKEGSCPLRLRGASKLRKTGPKIGRALPARASQPQVLRFASCQITSSQNILCKMRLK